MLNALRLPRLIARLLLTRACANATPRVATFESVEPRRLLAALGGDDLSGVPADMLAEAYLFVGDHSSSNSEKWGMQVGLQQYGGAAQDFGEVTRAHGSLLTGRDYAIRVTHLDTNRYIDGEKAPDYDLRSWFDDYASPAWTDGQSVARGKNLVYDRPGGIDLQALFR